MPDESQSVEYVDVPVNDPEPHPSLDADRDPAGDPTHHSWQGHTHAWPKRATKGVFVCGECGAEEPSEVMGVKFRG